MRPGQTLTRWFQQLLAGQLKTPQAIYAAAMQEVPDPAQGWKRFLEEDVPSDDGWKAPERLRAPGFILTERHLRQWDRADWQYCDRRLMRWSAVFVELARKRGIPLYVHTAFRNAEEQARVNVAGNSKAPWPRSPHNIGEAVDIVHGVYHWQLSKQEWSLLHLLGLRALDLVNAGVKAADRLALTWGGDFKSLYDPAHWEVADYRKRIRPIVPGPPVTYTPRFILGMR